MTWYLWVSTVRGDSPSAAATSFIVHPCAISETTSRWRVVSGPPKGGRPSASTSRTSDASWGVMYLSPRATVRMAAISSLPAACFTTNPDAPARSASAARWASACMVRTISLTCAGLALNRRRTSSPFMPGMERSVTMTSGRSRSAASINCAPSVTVPARSNSALRRLDRPSRTIAWSSASSTLVRRVPVLVSTRCRRLVRGQRHHGIDLGASLRLRVDRETASDDTDTLVEADQAQPASDSRLLEVEPAPIVTDEQHQMASLALQTYPHVAGLCMPAGIP